MSSPEHRIDPEAYFTVSQGRLVLERFRRQRAAMAGAMVLLLLILCGLFAPFLSPHDPTIAGSDRAYLDGAPTIPRFCDRNGCSARPFLHKVERVRSIETNLRWVERVSEDERRYVRFLVPGAPYRLFGLFTLETRLFGVDEGYIHLFGTDSAGKDIFSRTLHAIWTSLTVGVLGVLVAFVLALVIGGISGFVGGWVDSVIQTVSDAVKIIPRLPLFMAMAAFLPQEWSAETRFLLITTLLGLKGWPTLARRVRTHILTERSQDYVLAAQLCGAGMPYVLRRHLLPSFTSYIIVDLVISFPYMVLSETALSFIGLGLKDPVNSLGVMLQNATSADVILNHQWYFIPVVFFIALVLAFVFVGDGLRDAVDPYAEIRR
ncbi:ABC transporter permease [Prosthecomicrobium sp. N25]|uniref:ABC transporter permease n=1 Tax=Prosthecomicrobium sp. N25 TaxID=3129254 RepID=UPI0030773DC3